MGFHIAKHIFQLTIDETYFDQTETTTTDFTPVSESEKDIINYIAGSLVRKLKRKQQPNNVHIDILKFFKDNQEGNESETGSSKRSLTKIHDRGGLTRVNYKFSSLLLEYEHSFRKKTPLKAQDRE